MLIENLLKVIDKCLPPESAMTNDRLGLQVQSGRREVNRILVTLELNEEVISEAIEKNSDCIITFHPLIFHPLTSINDNDRVGKLCSELIHNSIALIAIHTNFDAYSQGTSKIFADKLGLESIGFLTPDLFFEDCGMGIIAKPTTPLSSGDLLEKISSICLSPLRYCEGKKIKDIKKIAIVGGSGSSFLDNAIESGADVYITADITYHTFHKALGRIMLIDAGHYEMEKFVPYALADFLKSKLGDGYYKSIFASYTWTNPVRYYPMTDYYTEKQKEFINISKGTV
jgi:GTP cyclohydrolase I